MKKYLVVSAAMLACLTFTSMSMAVEQAAANRPGVVIGSIINVKANVQAINAEAREVTLKKEDGKTIIIVCGPEVQNFSQIKVGDQVDVAYGETAMLFIKDATGELEDKQGVAMERAPLGEKPAAAAVAVTELQAAVEDINYETRLISLKDAAGKKLSFIIGEEVERLNEIKKGDHVVARLTQAVAITVTTPTSN